MIELIEPLTPEQWGRIGANYPQRVNDEDERRSVGVIAHHVAVSAQGIMERTLAVAEGRTPRPLSDFSAENAKHAAANAEVTKADVLNLLRTQTTEIVATLRTLTDDQLDRTSETPAGPMSVAQRIERVLIGHLTLHRGSIEAALGDSRPLTS